MDMRTACRVVGINRSGKDEIKKMKKALSMHSWLNTPEEKERLEACDYVLANWAEYQEACSTLRAEIHRAFG